MKNRKYYEQLFNKYPDVVTLSQFRNMLGGIGDGTARKLMRENRVKHYYIRSTYAPLVERLHGQVIKISPTSTNYINPMDLNLD